jgi:hypothetical protein
MKQFHSAKSAYELREQFANFAHANRVLMRLLARHQSRSSHIARKVIRLAPEAVDAGTPAGPPMFAKNKKNAVRVLVRLAASSGLRCKLAEGLMQPNHGQGIALAISSQSATQARRCFSVDLAARH